ncbi:MAG TPA: peptidase [Enterococcus sp.]|nr:peptidase [Enterococcus sp.]
MKKTLAFAGSLILFALPLVGQAEETVDQKIQQQIDRINNIKGKSASVEAYKQATEKEIQQIEAEIAALFDEKSTTEQQVNQIVLEIQTLEGKIAKRTETLANQARDIQVSEPSSKMMDSLLTAESFGEVIQRAIASVTIMNASNSIVEQQQKDIETSQALEEELTAKLTEIDNNTQTVEKKQTELADIYLNQEVELAALAISLNEEEGKKADLEKEKAEAERKREAALKQKAAEEALAKEVKAAAKAEAEKQAALQAEVEISQARQSQKQSTNTAAKTEKAVVSTVPVKESVENDSTETETPTAASGWSMPVDAVHISSRFGYRSDPTGSSGNQHNGIDFTGASGTPIYAMQAGTVVEAGYGPSTGNYVVIKHDNGIYSYYMHFNQLPAVSVGQSVSARQYIGGMGTTGNSTGVHLHLGMATGLWSGFFDPASELGL